MNRTMRLSSLVLALVVTIGLVATTASPVQALPGSAVVARATPPVTAVDEVAGDHVVAARSNHAPSRSAGTPRSDGHVKPFKPHTYYMGHEYCGGWWQGPAWCLTFNKAEAGYISAVSLSVAAAFICAGTVLITCGVAVGIAAAIQRYVDHHGVCPSAHPRMRVEYIPHPGTVSCH